MAAHQHFVTAADCNHLIMLPVTLGHELGQHTAPADLRLPPTVKWHISAGGVSSGSPLAVM